MSLTVSSRNSAGSKIEMHQTDEEVQEIPLSESMRGHSPMQTTWLEKEAGAAFVSIR